MDKRRAHKKLCHELHHTYVMKNSDYGDSFGESLDKHGLIAAIVRMDDKLNRLDSLKDRAGKVKDETLMDTALDLANYAIMTAMWLEGKRKAPGITQLNLFTDGVDTDGDYISTDVSSEIDYRGGLVGKHEPIEVNLPFDSNGDIRPMYEEALEIPDSEKEPIHITATRPPQIIEMGNDVYMHTYIEPLECFLGFKNLGDLKSVQILTKTGTEVVRDKIHNDLYSAEGYTYTGYDFSIFDEAKA